MLKLTNTQPGPRGVNTVSGTTLVDPKETVEVDVYQREKEHLEASGWFDISGSYKANPTEVSSLAFEVSGLEDLQAQLKAKDEEIASLKAAKTNAPAFEAKHRGAGSYSILDADSNEVAEKLSKEDAETFNAMSDEDKAAYVAAKK